MTALTLCWNASMTTTVSLWIQRRKCCDNLRLLVFRMGEWSAVQYWSLGWGRVLDKHCSWFCKLKQTRVVHFCSPIPDPVLSIYLWQIKCRLPDRVGDETTVSVVWAMACKNRLVVNDRKVRFVCPICVAGPPVTCSGRHLVLTAFSWLRLGLGYGGDTIHCRDSRAHHSNTIVSDCTIHLLGYLRYVPKTCTCDCLCLQTNLNTFFVDSSVDQIEPLYKHSLRLNTDVWVSTFFLLHSNISVIFCTNLHQRSVIEHTAVRKWLQQIRNCEIQQKV